MLIGGDAAAAEGGRTFTRDDPFTGEPATSAPAASADDARRAADAAAAALPGWAAMGPTARRALLNAAADLMDARADEFVALMTSETGATAPWGGFNVMLGANVLREAAAMTTQVGGEVIPANKPGTLAMAIRKPVGVCLGIAPWNAPVILGTRAVAMPLACGNTVVLKASEACPGVHRLIGSVLAEAGIPDGVVNVVTNDPADAGDVVNALIRHPAVRHVNFTGSTAVGRKIAVAAAEELKPALLELGGKAPLVVLADADLDAAVNAAIFGAFMNQGQICMSTERLVVDESIADAFVEKLAARASALPAGDPRGQVVLGSLVSEAAAERMEALIADATDRGGKVVAGGSRRGTVVEATVIDRVTPDMRLYAEESFGPVKPDRAREPATTRRCGSPTTPSTGCRRRCSAADVRRAMAVADRIESGICHVNGPTLADEPQMPFGGVKSSGYGRFGGRAAIDEFTVLRWVTIEDPHQHYPF